MKNDGKFSPDWLITRLWTRVLLLGWDTLCTRYKCMNFIFKAQKKRKVGKTFFVLGEKRKKSRKKVNACFLLLMGEKAKKLFSFSLLVVVRKSRESFFFYCSGLSGPENVFWKCFFFLFVLKVSFLYIE